VSGVWGVVVFWGMGKPKVVVTEHLDEAAFAWLSERAVCERVGLADARLGAVLAEAEGVVIRTYTKVDAGFLARSPRLRVVGRAGVGLDNVDLEACAARGVRVVHTPDANSTAVVEYVLALMLDATRPRGFMPGAVSKARWDELRNELKAKRQVCELTVGILGLGKIGRRVARVLGALGARVIYHDLVEVPAERREGAEPVSREELFARADVVTIHVDGRAANRGNVGAGDFGRCKSEVIVINTSRGFVVDNHALADFMLGHPGACAMLDVHEPEPFDATYPLLEIENVHLAPHIASSTALAHANMSWVVKDVWRVLEGGRGEFEA
jgi:phosphoglycerate dehydrogenase-like enzyme